MENSALFEFSIPKYIYGHNLEAYPLNKEVAIHELNDFIHVFIKDNFDLYVNPERIRILRLDICYNHFFKNSIQKHQYKKMIIDNGGVNFPARNIRKYENETIMLKYDEYSFKMYDKGAEFKKNDYPKLCESIGIPESNKLQKKADLILRFEITIRASKISDILMQNYNFLIYSDLSLNKKIKELKRFYNMISALTNYLVTNGNKYKSTKDEKYKKKIKERLKNSDYDSITFNVYMLKNYVDAEHPLKDNYIEDCYDTATKSMIKEYRKIFNVKKFFLKTTHITKLLNKSTVGFHYEFTQLLFILLLDLFNSKMQKMTESAIFNPKEIKTIILMNEQLIKNELGINPNKLINYLDNTEMRISRNTLKNYIRDLTLIEKNYSTDIKKEIFFLK